MWRREAAREVQRSLRRLSRVRLRTHATRSCWTRCVVLRCDNEVMFVPSSFLKVAYVRGQVPPVVAAVKVGHSVHRGNRRCRNKNGANNTDNITLANAFQICLVVLGFDCCVGVHAVYILGNGVFVFVLGLLQIFRWW